MTTDQIITQLGGYRHVALKLGLHRTTVCKWLRAGFPAAKWEALESLALQQREYGITIDTIRKATKIDD